MKGSGMAADMSRYGFRWGRASARPRQLLPQSLKSLLLGPLRR